MVTALQNGQRTTAASPQSGNYVAITPHALNGHRVTVKQNPEGITVDVKSRTDPPHAYPSLTGGCGGFLPYRFDLNLDAEPVTVTAKPDEGVLTNTVPGSLLCRTTSAATKRRYGISLP